jgi:CheY-specific phosphatase CheX
MLTATPPAAKPAAGFPQPVADALVASVESVLGTICGQKPVKSAAPAGLGERPCVIAILSFDGTPAWTVTCRLTDETAPDLMRKFAGFDIPFDSADMGDVVGEFVNVLAGEVIAQLERRRMKHRMSLPTVLRGIGMQLVPESGATSRTVEFAIPQGRIQFEMITPKGTLQTRMPGA